MGVRRSDGRRRRNACERFVRYPLGWPGIPEEIKRADLAYYEARTLQNGFFTGDSVYSIAWLALGNASAASTQWLSAFAHMDTDCFFTFHEKLKGGHLNFITGAGGFLQNVINGMCTRVPSVDESATPNIYPNRSWPLSRQAGRLR